VRSRIKVLVGLIACGALATGCSRGSGEADATGASTEPPSVTSTTSAQQIAPPNPDYGTGIGTVSLPCQGRGPVPIVLIAGTDDPIERWDDLIDDMGQQFLVCRFDADAAAAGEAAGTITPAARSDALATALDASGLRGPFLLLGHSLGGLTVRQFGADHGDLLGAAILLDATTPTALLSLHDQLTATGWDAEATQAQADAAVVWPDVPLTVLAHDPALLTLGSAAIEDLWTQGQEQYGELTPDATVEVVTGSGHYIDRDAPVRVLRSFDVLVQDLAG